MTDNGRRGMVPDQDSADMRDVVDEHGRPVTTKCDVCGYLIPFGGWPFCGPAPADFRRHWRDFSSAKLAVWDEACASNPNRPNTTPVKDK